MCRAEKTLGTTGLEKLTILENCFCVLHSENNHYLSKKNNYKRTVDY